MISRLSDRSKLMELEEAKKHREELMKECKFFVQTRSLPDPSVSASTSLFVISLFLFF